MVITLIRQLRDGIKENGSLQACLEKRKNMSRYSAQVSVFLGGVSWAVFTLSHWDF